mmetsp:Transcript_38217/g.85148  ORF Transcript_38217/g.85148 Transcript_38217/m.85148 type:complete len:200 (+) Transcript_38217:72-671(+)
MLRRSLQSFSPLLTRHQPAAWNQCLASLGSDQACSSSCSFKGYSTEEGKKAEPAVGNERVQKLADEIVGLTVLEASWLSEILRKKLDIQKPAFGAMPMAMPMMGAALAAASAAAPAAAAPAAEEKKKEKTEFEVKLESFTADGKIKVIKEIRAITNLGLKEAKELVEKAPVVIKGGVAKADAENWKKLIEAAGGKVSLV